MASGNPYQQDTLIDYVRRCALGESEQTFDDHAQFVTGCAIAQRIKTIYAPFFGPPESCPPTSGKVPPPADAAAECAAVIKSSDIAPSVVETAALEYAQTVYPLAVSGAALQQAMCGKGYVPPPAGPSSPAPGGAHYDAGAILAAALILAIGAAAAYALS